MSGENVNVVGAGLCGALMSIYLARRGYRVELFEARSDLRAQALPAGRSINLALANRGLRALDEVGLGKRVREQLTLMRGRMIHDESGQLEFQPYGQRPWEVIYSVSRTGLNALLLDAAEQEHGVRIHFRHPCTGVDLEADRLTLLNQATGVERTLRLSPTVAADGAGSVIRQALEAAGITECRTDWLAHAYKELTIPPSSYDHWRIEPHALHIWPRGGYMLIALPNLDHSFTVTLFLPAEGNPGFDQLNTPQAVRQFFDTAFPDTRALIPDLERAFFANPTSPLGTVRCAPWNAGGQVCLVGDAAHAIVPFHGQGMNAAFEDCLELDRHLETSDGDFEKAFRRFSLTRKASAEAIADMALENYVEMRDSVRDPAFVLRKAVAFELERRAPDRFVPRYSMVMFRDDVSYADAQRRGAVQREILDQVTAGRATLEECNLDVAEALVHARLEPLAGEGPGLPEARAT